MSNDFIEQFNMRAEHAQLHVQCAGDGDLNSEIAIVSAYPGSRDVQLKRPMVGESGDLLFKHLRRTGITRPECYVTNVIKRMVGVKKKVPIEEFRNWADLLMWELSQMPNLKYIYCLGNEALQALVGMTGITSVRGSVYDIEINNRTVQAMITYNPANVKRNPNTEPVFALDMHKFLRVIKGEFAPFEIEAHINPTFRDACAYLNGLIHRKKPVVLDIELTGMDVACYGFADNKHSGMCINLRDDTKNRYSVEEELEITMLVQQVFDNCPIIVQNGAFDCTYVGFHVGLYCRAWFDTMLAHHLLYPQLPHSLAFLTTQYTDHSFYKDEKDAWKDQVTLDHDAQFIDGFWRYNVKDCCVTYACYETLLDHLKKYNLDEFFFNHVMRLHPHLIDATIEGVAVDIEERDKFAEELKTELAILKDHIDHQIHEYSGIKTLWININAPKQLETLFYDVLGADIGVRKRSTDKETRAAMLQSPSIGMAEKNIINDVDTWKKKHKLYSTYATARLDADNRMRCDWKQTGVAAAPGRLSSAKTSWGTGLNLQNQPPAMQKVFTVDDIPDGVMFYFDRAQVEARYCAWMWDIPKWIAQFEQARIDGNYDCHRALASDMFKIPYDEVPTFDHNEDGTITVRYKAKRCLAADHEVLTKRGWILIGEAEQSSEEIAVWDNHGVMKWERPKIWYVGDDEDDWLIEYDGENTSMLMTFDHDVCVLGDNGLVRKINAQHTLSMRKSSIKMPMSGIVYEGRYEPYARLLAMSWADGTIEKHYPNSIRVSVLKERKAKRVQELCNEAGLRYWYSQTKNGMHHYRIYGYTRKALDYDLLSWDYDSRLAFLDELKHWDGCPETGRIFNCDRHGLDVIQAVAHITGMACTPHKHGKPNDNQQQCYVLRPKERKATSPQEIYVVKYSGRVYCPTVSTGMFLTRRDKKVTVSSNCRHGLNYRMEKHRLAQTTGMPYSEAARCWNLYHAETPEVQEAWQQILFIAKRDKKLVTPMGRPLPVLGDPNDPEVQKSLIAFMPQSLNGDFVGKVWYEAHEHPKWPKDARIRINVHDALIGVAKNREIGMEALSILKPIAEQPMYIQDIYGRHKPRELIVPVDCKITEVKNGKVNWSTLEKVKL